MRTAVTTAAGHARPAAVAVLLGSLLSAPFVATAPASAHPGGRTPYRYVVAPPGVDSEGPPEPGSSVQPIGTAGFAGTTDNQMQLTLPPGALPARAGEQGVRVELEQLDPATLPPLPDGLEPEGNAYRLTLVYSRSGSPVARLTGATLSLTAPVPPTGLLELVDSRWQPLASTTVVGDEAVSSVVDIARPGMLLQVHDPATAPRPAASSLPAAQVSDVDPAAARGSARRDRGALLPGAAAVTAGLVAVGLLRARRRRSAG